MTSRLGLEDAVRSGLWLVAAFAAMSPWYTLLRFCSSLEWGVAGVPAWVTAALGSVLIGVLFVMPIWWFARFPRFRWALVALSTCVAVLYSIGGVLGVALRLAPVRFLSVSGDPVANLLSGLAACVVIASWYASKSRTHREAGSSAGLPAGGPA